MDFCQLWLGKLLLVVAEVTAETDRLITGHGIKNKLTVKCSSLNGTYIKPSRNMRRAGRMQQPGEEVECWDYWGILSVEHPMAVAFLKSQQLWLQKLHKIESAKSFHGGTEAHNLPPFNKIYGQLMVAECGGLNRNSTHRLMCLYVWPTGSDTFMKCALLEKVGHCGSRLWGLLCSS